MGISSFLGHTDKTPPTGWLGKLAPEVKLAVPSDFQSAVNKEDSEKGGVIPLTSRDMSLYHAGTALSRIELKIGNRFGENFLISAVFWLLFNDFGHPLFCRSHHDLLSSALPDHTVYPHTGKHLIANFNIIEKDTTVKTNFLKPFMQ